MGKEKVRTATGRTVPSSVFESGDWLHGKLTAAGATDAEASSVCFALGQRQAMLDPGEDPWDVARDSLARYLAGDVDVPGAELSRKLIAEKFGEPTDWLAFARWVATWLAAD